MERSGIHTTFQDHGRFKFQHLGISPSGAMDTDLLKISNKLVNNNINEGVIEFAYQGPRLKLIFGRVKVSICGNVHFKIERKNKHKFLNEKYNCFESYVIEKGDVLDILATKKSIYGYLSIQGGFNLHKFFNSVSTSTNSNIGPNNGKKIQNEDIIYFISNVYDERKNKMNYDYNFNDNIVRVVKGPQYHYFSKNSIKDFFSLPFIVSNNIDRMGLRIRWKKN